MNCPLAATSNTAIDQPSAIYKHFKKITSSHTKLIDLLRHSQTTSDSIILTKSLTKVTRRQYSSYVIRTGLRTALK